MFYVDAVPGPSSDLPLPCANLLLLSPNRLNYVDPQKRGDSAEPGLSRTAP